VAAIGEVKVYLVPLARRPGYPPYRLTVVEVRDADGATGIGEVGLVYGDGASAAAKMVLEIAGNYLIGHDGGAITAFAHRAYRNAFWSQSGGAVWFGALSALDEALWDLRGRRAGEPVHRLLGGPAQPEIRFYCNGWSRSATDPDDWGRRAAEAVAAGYDALKFDPYKYRPDGSARSLTEKVSPGFHRLAVARAAAVREAVGPDVDLILELHGNLSRLEALRACTDIAQIAPWYVEEPLDGSNPESLARFAAEARLPLAAGERFCGVQKFVPYLASGALAVVQPDLGLCGGLTEGMRIAALAAAHGAEVQPHNCGGPISTAACVQLAFAVPNFLVQEVFPGFTDGRYDLVEQPIEPTIANGRMAAPEAPGLGVTLNRDFLKGHAEEGVAA
jgi:L-alanine-DL-glutamate epimerase-like enolase superfamily enzyme